ncbi:hypothetical protein A2154_03055 [Candidatus Gottesmanbacteria bacterium RBG_16_43_7]|uniref:Transcriptional regulator n=1 Tax=Candidatus Gottesmanbacteria bacterium RBG_16_43_7 TaxID=1798373 RepID=A0A1F5ZAU2_9BACT|nr:MAG: hypothetical protein A2154_03055 [Candidatus Gottesmanbacteria bacterium RBG_16_43_7]
MKVPFLDLRVLDKTEKKALLAAAERVFTHGRIVLGPEVGELEDKLAKFCQRKYAVGVNSGTDALILGLKAAGIGPGDEVITTSLSWVATANAIAILGARPVFADIDDDLNISPESVKRLVSKKTKAILPVHFTGRICRMNEILTVARKNKLLVIEDAAQAFGAIRGGRPVGSFGDIACFSTNPMKVYAALGEAGFVVTNSKRTYDRLVSLRYNGTVNKETCIEVSLNGRIDTVQAAMLLVRLKTFQKLINRRRRNAAFYDRELKGISAVLTPPVPAGAEHVYYTYTLRARKRDQLRVYLENHGIETKIQHPILMPDQPVYLTCRRDKLIRAKRMVGEIVCIPVHEKLTSSDLKYIAKHIKAFYLRH